MGEAPASEGTGKVASDAQTDPASRIRVSGSLR